MKIAIVCDRVYPYFKGGVEKRYWDIARTLSKKGYEFHFYTGQWPGMEKEMVIDDIYLHGVYKVKNFYVNGKKSIKESIIYSLKLFPYLLRADFDVIDCDQFPLLSIFPSWFACKYKGKPLIVTWHEPWGKHWFKYVGYWIGLLGYLTERIVIQLPNKIISVSRHTSQGLIKTLKVNGNKIVEIPNAIDNSFIEKINPSSIKSDVIFVGRLLHHKNVDILIKSITTVCEKVPSVKCIIVGDGPEKEKLIELVQNLNLAKNIKFLGKLEHHGDVISLMKSSKVLVLPSTREGFGLVAIEAMACGVPVITVDHNNNAVGDLIHHGKDGFVCKLDTKEIAGNIFKIVTNGLRQKMSGECIKTAKTYDWGNIIKKLEEVYK